MEHEGWNKWVFEQLQEGYLMQQKVILFKKEIHEEIKSRVNNEINFLFTYVKCGHQ